LAKENPGLHRLLGALVFPVGLGMITLTGAELLTSNFYYSSIPILTGRGGSLRNSFRVWTASFAGNVVGSLCLAVACANTVFVSDLHAPWLVSLVEQKCNLSFGVAFTKAIGANFLVNVAVFSAASCSTPGGKIVALWGPIACFVLLGLEHSVANMFFLPLGILRGARVTWEDMVAFNLVPVIMGNLVGALLLVKLQAPKQASFARLFSGPPAS